MADRCPTAVLLCSSEDAFLMSVVIRECEGAGIASTIDTPTLDAGDTWDVACIFWCKHTFRSSEFERRCRRVLSLSGRSLIVHLDDTPLPSFLQDEPRVRLREAGHCETGQTGTRMDQWQTSVATFIPDIESDAAELRKQLYASLGDFKSWLAIGPADVPRDGPSWRTIGDTAVAMVCCASLVAGIAVFEESFRGGTLAFGIYIVFLVLWYFIATPPIFLLLDRIVDLEGDSPGCPTIFVVFAGSAFVVTCLGCSFIAGAKVLALGTGGILIFSVVFTGLALASFAAGWLVMRTLYRLTKMFPAKTHALFISYPSLEASVWLKRFLDELELALSKRHISYFDSCGFPRGPARTRSKRFMKARLRSALRSSGFALMFISDEYLSSRFGNLEFTNAAALRRPLLQLVIDDLSPINERKLRPKAFRLPQYLREAQEMFDKPSDPNGGPGDIDRLLQRFRSDLSMFIGSLCGLCHGHGTDPLYRFRFMPQPLRLRCLNCNGTGRDPIMKHYFGDQG